MKSPFIFVKWIPVEKIRPLISIEVFGLVIALLVLGVLFYSFFLKKITEKRHRNLRSRFISTTVFFLSSATFSVLHYLLLWDESNELYINKISSYSALAALVLGAVAIIKVAQIYVYLYLFFVNMSQGVPRLIGNVFTFLFSIFIFGLLGSAIFDLNIATIATTSAVFSLVLGLALQDTLGNLFSGLALQVDQPFQINDWVEIHSGAEKWVGQVQEVNWRATYLLTFADELLIVPNKTVAQGQILILNNKVRPIRLNQVFRFSHDINVEEAKAALLEGPAHSPDVLNDPAPSVLITESHESWITMKVFYSLKDFATRYQTGDKIISNIMASLKRRQIKVSHPRMEIVQR